MKALAFLPLLRGLLRKHLLYVYDYFSYKTSHFTALKVLVQ